MNQYSYLKYFKQTSRGSNRQSALAIVVVESKVFFIKRSEAMPTHKGDIAFFGGHAKKDESMLDAAKREFSEESSLSATALILRNKTPLLTHGNQSIQAFVFDYKYSTDHFIDNLKSNSEWDHGFFVHTNHFYLNEYWSFGVSSSKGLDHRIFFCDLGQKGKNLWGISALLIRYLVDEQVF